MRGLGVINRHAIIKGMPIIEENDAERFLKAILAMRDTNLKKHKIMHAASKGKQA